MCVYAVKNVTLAPSDFQLQSEMATTDWAQPAQKSHQTFRHFIKQGHIRM